jgi:hypothetical protein
MKPKTTRQSLGMRSVAGLTVIAAAATLALSPPSQAATVLYEDDFNGLTANNLHGTNPGGTLGTTNAWHAATTFKADGSVEAIGTSGGRGAFLAFTPTVGKIYTLAVSLTDGNTDPNNNWLAAGFTQSVPSDFTTSTRHADTSVNGMVWALHRVNDTHPTNSSNPANQQFFAGPRTGTAMGSWEFQTPTVDLVITLNTVDANNVLASLNINGGVAEVTNFNVGTLAALAITGVGLSNDGANIGTFANFSLTEAIPETSTSMIGLIGACLLLRRRRI